MSQLKKCMLTIGIPTYNGGDNFIELFSSINNLGLAKDDYEIVVVDNASTDGTAERMEQFRLQLPNLNYHRNLENIGRIENWNKAIELARGSYLIIMNVNDRFEQFDLKKHINFLERNPDIPVMMTDIEYADHVYPNWLEGGVLSLDAYLKKTFLESEYLEFHSLGVLHQHIFRTRVIRDYGIKFDPTLPRTTDRVFTAEVIEAGGGKFYYSNRSMVKWQLNNARYHFNVHNKIKEFNFEDVWVNEYKANTKLASIAGISYGDILKSQLTLASFFLYRKKFRKVKSAFSPTETTLDGIEVPTSPVFFSYLKAMAELNGTPINYMSVKFTGFCRMLNWYLRSLKLSNQNQRSLKGLITPAQLN